MRGANYLRKVAVGEKCKSFPAHNCSTTSPSFDTISPPVEFLTHICLYPDMLVSVHVRQISVLCRRVFKHSVPTCCLKWQSPLTDNAVWAFCSSVAALSLNSFHLMPTKQVSRAANAHFQTNKHTFSILIQRVSDQQNMPFESNPKFWKGTWVQITFEKYPSRSELDVLLWECVHKLWLPFSSLNCDEPFLWRTLERLKTLDSGWNGLVNESNL